MPELSKLLSSAAIAAVLALPLTVSAAEHTQPEADQTEPDAVVEEAADGVDASTVVVTVNGEQIKLGHMIAAAAILPEQYRQLEDSVLFDGILAQLVQQTALAQNFDTALPQRIIYQMENEKRSLVAAEVLQVIVEEAVSEEDIRAAYDAEVAEMDTEEEFNASHILVETEEEALALIEQLNNGERFEILARDNSTGPSGPSGGSLGWFNAGMMVPAFEAAVISLEPNEISDPVQTQFGWHVIRLNETRMKDIPTYEERRDEIELELQRNAASDAIEGYGVDSEVIEPEGAVPFDPALVRRLDLLE